MVEGWAFVVVAIIAFVAGLLIGDLGTSKTETVYVSTPPAERQETGAPEVKKKPVARRPEGRFKVKRAPRSS